MSYFDVKISQIPFGWPGRPRTGVDEDLVPVDVTRLTPERWAELYKTFRGHEGEEPLCFVEIEDNGQHGDGIKFRICAGDPSTVVLETGIPDESLDTLIEALTAVRRLRRSESA